MLDRLDQGVLAFDTSRLERRLDTLVRIGRRVVSAILFAGLLVGGVLLLPLNPVLGTVLIAVSALPLLHAVFGGVAGRRPR